MTHHVKVIITVDDHTMRYETDVDELQIYESMITNELTVRPNPRPEPQSWGTQPSFQPSMWEKYLDGDNWDKD